ncbi:hypothetical protein GN316_11225 [Xylophilus sp. Kf1]|nr:hypothetical protein [Xylophilus sp. Kf1]
MSDDAWHTIHIHRDAPPRPALGRPCNGCGQCCLVEPCPVGMLVSRKRTGACHALRWSDDAGRYLCGLVAGRADGAHRPGAVGRLLAPWVSRLARRWISAGSGCDAPLQAEDAKPGA